MLADDLAKLRARVHRLEIGNSELEATCDSLQKQLQSVRGMMTGGIRHAHKAASGVSGIPEGDKEALRAYAGLSLIRKPQGD